MIIYGCGGHGKVILEALLASDGDRNVTFVDDNPQQKEILGIPVKTYSEELLDGKSIVLAFGNNQLRKEKKEQIAELVHAYASIIHPLAYISPSAKVMEGTVVLVNSVVNTNSVIGDHSIINTGAIVDHDCIVGDYTHIAPNVTLCGHVEVGNNCLIGARAIVTPGVKIGNNVKIAAGITVSKDIPDNQTIFTDHV